MSTALKIIFLFIFYAWDTEPLQFNINETIDNYRYELHEMKKTHNKSEEYCRNNSGTLAMFNSDVLETILENMDVVEDVKNMATFFIGGDCSKPGTCTWNDGTTVNFTDLQTVCPKCNLSTPMSGNDGRDNCNWTAGSFLMARFENNNCEIKSRAFDAPYKTWWFMCQTELTSETTTDLSVTTKSLASSTTKQHTTTIQTTTMKSTNGHSTVSTTTIQTTTVQSTKEQPTTSTSDSDDLTKGPTTSSYANTTTVSTFQSTATFTNTSSSTHAPFTNMSSFTTSPNVTLVHGLLSATTKSLLKDCKKQDFCGVSFPPIKNGLRGYSTQSCEAGSPKATGMCNDGILTCISFNCSKTINELLKENVTSENAENIFSSLAITTHQTDTSNKSMQMTYDVTKYIADSITGLLKTNQTISANAISFILDTGTNACKNLNDKNDEKSLKSKLELALNLPKLSDLSQTENLKVESSDFSMKAEALSGENFSFGENSLEVNFNKEVFKHGERASVLVDKKGCLNPVQPENKSKIDQVVSVTVKGSVSRDNVALVTIVDKSQNNTKETIQSRDRFYIMKGFKCVYYHQLTNQWKDDGMMSISTENHVTCESTHFTNFALLVSTSVLPEDNALDIAGKIACSLSIVCLLGTILFNLRNRQVRKRRQTIMMVNISSNLLLVYVLFVAGISQTRNRTACTAVAICLHYFMLASWMWMAVYSYDLYFSLVVVFERHASHFLKKSFCLSYGVPLTVVVINSSISLNKLPNDDGYYLASNMCWLKGHSLNFGLLLPIGILLLFNFIMYILVMRSITCGTKETLANGEKRSNKEGLVLGTAFALTTGLSWAFAYFMLFSQNQSYLIMMSWFFTISTGLQGMLIFMLTCVRHQSFKHSIISAWNFVVSCCGRSERLKLHSKLKSTSFSTNAGTMSTTNT